MRFAILLPSRGGKASAMRGRNRFRSKHTDARQEPRHGSHPVPADERAAEPKRRGHSRASLAMIARLMLEYKQLKYSACYYR